MPAERTADTRSVGHFPRGTDGSNPVPSSEESAANSVRTRELSVLPHQQKLVEENGRRGLIVSGIDAERIRELYQVRTALDALAARLAAERIAGRVTDSQPR